MWYDKYFLIHYSYIILHDIYAKDETHLLVEREYLRAIHQEIDRVLEENVFDKNSLK